MKPTCEELEKLVRDQNKLIKQLQERISVLEDKLNKNSKNSSKPPSSDQKSNKHIIKKKVKSPYHSGASRQLLPVSAVTSHDARKI